MTPETLRAAYAFLRTTKPFSRWGLPSAGEVAFAVLKTRGVYGDYRFQDGRHRIRASSGMNGHAVTLLETIAHEMVHLRQAINALEVNHGRYFRASAKQVCRHHGFDPKRF